MTKRLVTVIIRANMEVEEGQDTHELAKSIKEHGLGPENTVSIAKVSVHPARNSSKLHKPLSKEQLAHRLAKKKTRPGGRQQPKGTQPYVQVLPDKPAWKPIPVVTNKLLSDAVLAQKLGIRWRADIPDMRCPKCNSSRIAKEQLLKCPECGYEGNCVDVNAPKEEVEPIELESPTGRIRVLGPELQNLKPPQEPKVDAAEPSSISAMDKFKAGQRNHINGGQNGKGD